MNQYYNNDVLTAIEREDGAHVGDVLNHIFIADAKWKMTRKMTLRGEAQYMKSSDGKDYQIFKWNSNGAQATGSADCSSSLYFLTGCSLYLTSTMPVRQSTTIIWDP